MKIKVGKIFIPGSLPGFFPFFSFNKILLFGLGLILTFTSCTLEQKLGNQFVKNEAGTIAIMIIPTDYIYKENLKTYEIKNFNGLSKTVKDSMLFENSLFLKEISDSIFLNHYISELSELLSDYGFRCYSPTEFESFLNHKGQNYVVTLAQVELEEYRKVVTTEDIFGEDDYYHEEFPLNALNVNSWFEVSRLNDTNSVKKQVLYASHYIFDDFESHLVENPFTGEVTFKYSIDSITSESIYNFARFLGFKYGEYLFDYFLNSYIFEKFPAEREPEIYIHYDYSKRISYSAGNERFIFLE